jgi:hypothetical protein
MQGSIKKNKYTTAFSEECRSKGERFLIIVIMFKNYVLEVKQIICNLRKDARKYKLSSFSILYNSLVKYPLLGFQPSAYFMYRLYENSFTDYLNLFEEVNSVIKINKHNPNLLDNKLDFKHQIQDRVRTPTLVAFFDGSSKKISYITNPTSRDVVIKPIARRGGTGISIVPSKNLKSVLKQNKKKCIVEERIDQHKDMNAIFNGSINTLRVLTLKEDNDITISSVILRAGRNITHHVDNIAQGGICIDIDKATGMIGKGYTFYKFGHCEYTSHPDSNYRFYGKKIPFFQEVLDLAINTHRYFPMFTIIGWDIAISETGPILIEGNRVPDLSLHQIFMPLKDKLRLIL